VERADGRSLVGGVLSAAGGALGVVGALMTWLVVTFRLLPLRERVVGTDGTGGRVALAFAAAAILAGLASIAVPPAARRPFALLALLAGLVVLAVPAYNWATKDRQTLEALGRTAESLRGRFTPAQIRSLLGLEVHIASGLWVTAAGGALATAGGAIGSTVPPPVADGPPA
jgi:hypothetical protein